MAHRDKMATRKARSIFAVAVTAALAVSVLGASVSNAMAATVPAAPPMSFEIGASPSTPELVANSSNQNATMPATTTSSTSSTTATTQSPPLSISSPSLLPPSSAASLVDDDPAFKVAPRGARAAILWSPLAAVVIAVMTGGAVGAEVLDFHRAAATLALSATRDVCGNGTQFIFYPFAVSSLENLRSATLSFGIVLPAVCLVASVAVLSWVVSRRADAAAAAAGAARATTDATNSNAVAVPPSPFARYHVDCLEDSAAMDASSSTVEPRSPVPASSTSSASMFSLLCRVPPLMAVISRINAAVVGSRVGQGTEGSAPSTTNRAALAAHMPRLTVRAVVALACISSSFALYSVVSSAAYLVATWYWTVGDIVAGSLVLGCTAAFYGVYARTSWVAATRSCATVGAERSTGVSAGSLRNSFVAACRGILPNRTQNPERASWCCDVRAYRMRIFRWDGSAKSGGSCWDGPRAAFYFTSILTSFGASVLAGTVQASTGHYLVTRQYSVATYHHRWSAVGILFCNAAQLFAVGTLRPYRSQFQTFFALASAAAAVVASIVPIVFGAATDDSTKPETWRHSDVPALIAAIPAWIVCAFALVSFGVHLFVTHTTAGAELRSRWLSAVAAVEAERQQASHTLHGPGAAAGQVRFPTGTAAISTQHASHHHHRANFFAVLKRLLLSPAGSTPAHIDPDKNANQALGAESLPVFNPNAAFFGLSPSAEAVYQDHSFITDVPAGDNALLRQYGLVDAQRAAPLSPPPPPSHRGGGGVTWGQSIPSSAASARSSQDGTGQSVSRPGVVLDVDVAAAAIEHELAQFIRDHNARQDSVQRRRHPQHGSSSESSVSRDSRIVDDAVPPAAGFDAITGGASWSRYASVQRPMPIRWPRQSPPPSPRTVPDPSAARTADLRSASISVARSRSVVSDGRLFSPARADTSREHSAPRLLVTDLTVAPAAPAGGARGTNGLTESAISNPLPEIPLPSPQSYYGALRLSSARNYRRSSTTQSGEQQIEEQRQLVPESEQRNRSNNVSVARTLRAAAAPAHSRGPSPSAVSIVVSAAAGAAALSSALSSVARSSRSSVVRAHLTPPSGVSQRSRVSVHPPILPIMDGYVDDLADFV